MKTLLSPFSFSIASLALAVLSPVETRGAEFGDRLGNFSTRAQVGTGANVMISGFVVGDGAAKKILIRAIGPGLAPFAVTGTLGDPVLSLFDAKGALLGTNNGWSASDASTMASAGAFALTPGSRDAALVATLAPGAYTAQVSSTGGTSGVALLEVYDVTGATRLLNLSTRAQVGAGGGTFIAGLVIAPGSGLRHLLVRAAGPALASFSVPGVNTDPALAVLDGLGRPLATNDNWNTANTGGRLASAITQVGAFQFQSGSKDAALVVDLPPGSFSILVSGVGGTTGVALVEVYDLTSASTAIVADEGDGAPGEGWGGYSNGKILPFEAMTAVAPNVTPEANGIQYENGEFYLEPHAAATFLAMQKAYGLTIPLTSAYRSYEHQGYLYAQREQNSNPVAAPGTSSHGWGLAVDIPKYSPANLWMQAHGSQYGWQWAGSDVIPDAVHFSTTIETAMSHLVTFDRYTTGGSVSSWISAGCLAAGVPANSAWITGYETAIGRESAGDANACNIWDGNAITPPGFSEVADWGNAWPASGAVYQLNGELTPFQCSRGVAQCTPQTFATYHAAGTSLNIYDPVANIAASINYVRDRYGVSVDGSDLASKVQQFDPSRPPKGYFSSSDK